LIDEEAEFILFILFCKLYSLEKGREKSLNEEVNGVNIDAHYFIIDGAVYI